MQTKRQKEDLLDLLTKMYVVFTKLVPIAQFCNLCMVARLATRNEESAKTDDLIDEAVEQGLCVLR